MTYHLQFLLLGLAGWVWLIIINPEEPVATRRCRTWKQRRDRHTTEASLGLATTFVGSEYTRFVVPQESDPALHLIGLGRAARHVSRHRHLRDKESELRELRVDTRCTPAVLRHHLDEPTNLGVDPRPPRVASLRDLCPVSTESIPIPPRDRVGVDDE